MKIRDLLDKNQPVFSFEFFPPKSDRGAETLFETIRELERLEPSFVSVTYGAGGSTRRKTLEIVTRIKKETKVEVLAHLTGIGHTRDEIRHIVEKLVDAGIENVLALRGDLPREEGGPQGDFPHASDLIRYIHELAAPLCVGAACYPEGHPEAEGRDQDLTHLKTKVHSGVDFLISQLFFDNADFFVFEKRAREIGIELPILPGIMPITNYHQIQRFTQMCGAKIPPFLEEELEAVKDNLEAVAGVGISYAIDQCRDLLRRKARGLHFYTLNKSPATRAILARLRREF